MSIKFGELDGEKEYLVWDQGYEEGMLAGEIINARDADEAAKKYLEWQDQKARNFGKEIKEDGYRVVVKEYKEYGNETHYVVVRLIQCEYHAIAA